jgi:hypothetical protein
MGGDHRGDGRTGPLIDLAEIGAGIGGKVFDPDLLRQERSLIQAVRAA